MKPDVRRISDGSMYEASFPDHWQDHDAVVACLTGSTGFYFRKLRKVNKKWWQFWKPEWERTGEVWQPESGEFEVLMKGDSE